MNANRDRWARTWLVFGAIWLTAAYAIAISHIQLIDPPGGSPAASVYSDAARYIGMVKGKAEPAPYRYRIVIPAVARLIPDGAIRRLTARPDPSADWLAGAKIVVLNIVFLAGAAALLFALCLEVGLSREESLVASLVFFVMRPVVQFGGMPMVDSGNWFFLVATAVLALRRRYLLLAATFALGMLTKETLLFGLPFILLSGASVRDRARLLAAVVPGIAVFFLVRYILADPRQASLSGAWWNLTRASTYDVHPGRTFSLGWLIDLGSAFGLLWIPAVYEAAKRRSTDLLRRWMIVPLIVLATIVVLSTNVGRIIFVAFPVVLPLAMLGMRRLSTRRLDIASAATAA